MKPKSKPPTLQDLFEQIREIQQKDEVLEQDLTVKKVMEEFDWSKSKSRRYIEILEKNGTVKREMVRGEGGKQTLVWRAK